MGNGDLAAGDAAIPPKWQQCNGRQLRKLVRAGLFWLEKNHQQVNALNVFPVPDGDTGTNMLLTMRAAHKQIEDSDEEHVGKVAQAVAHGALMGARGNSGVILSQIWRGLARALDENEAATAEDIARAFHEANETAYKGVMRPVEGTILTVVREASEEAQDAAKKSTDLRFLLERVLERAQQALERTPEMLSVLKQAGVVDAGGQGLVFILEGMLRYVEGQMEEKAFAAAAAGAEPAQARAAPDEGELEYPYDVQYLLVGDNLDVTTVRDAIDAMGDSTVVVGDERTIKVHVHVKDPGEPLSYGTRIGRVTDVVVENMQLQMEEIITGNEAPTPDVAAGEAPDGAAQSGAQVEIEAPTGEISVVAVAAGPGLGEIFRSLGAAGIVNGGQSNNPSTEEIYKAVEETPTDKVIILPNNKNIVLAAEAARDLSQKEVAVVPTRTAPQGISALLALLPGNDLESSSEAMTSASREIASGEITVATRSVTLDGVTVQEGEFIGLADGRLCTAGKEMGQVLADTLQAMEVEERELLSVYFGEDVSREEAESLVEEIGEQYPDVEIELLPGGQPHYMYILGAE
ncbi:MAG: DAK2 domain-containing protein [Candidatus Promineifilaceae bacterium]|nr:DAK2 domain-containing protein [Candidatus Promineifilaceae bacterium]